MKLKCEYNLFDYIRINTAHTFSIKKFPNLKCKIININTWESFPRICIFSEQDLQISIRPISGKEMWIKNELHSCVPKRGELTK